MDDTQSGGNDRGFIDDSTSNAGRMASPDAGQPRGGQEADRRATVHGHDVLVAKVIDLSTMVGLAALTVTGVCAASRVSPRTFYNHFADLGSAFTEGYVRIDADFRTTVEEALRGQEDPRAYATACVDAVIGYIRRDQIAAEALFVQGFAAGPEVAAIRADRLAWFGRLLVERLAVGGAGGSGTGSDARVGGVGRRGVAVHGERRQALLVELAVGGLSSVIFRHVVGGDLDDLAAGAPDLVDTLLRPFVTVGPAIEVGAEQVRRSVDAHRHVAGA